jgi:NAD(P)-dependent dehydrogenase (short-subunit alcohol dehydrogenase family)
VSPPALSNRVALITGAGRGIGLAIGRALAQAGCAVALQDIELDVAAQEVEKLQAAGHRALSLGGDVSDPTLPRKLIDQTLEKFARVDILINNAAIQHRVHWTQLSLADFEKTFRANVATPMLLCQLVAPILKAQRWGRIINIGSIQQLQGNEVMLDYAMTKAALENLTKALARDFAPHNVTVNLIAPGYIDTFRNREAFSTPEKKARAGRGALLGRIGEPQDMVGTAMLLCSDEGGYITGQSILIDGGMDLC